jgi:DNA-directed RNA polymerase specialized sigma24 family protein
MGFEEMGKRREETALGGPLRAFQTTQWSEIQKARTCDEARRQASVNNLMRRYWKPVYWSLRRRGYSIDDAKDLTQGFFCEIVLGRELIQQADQTKGRFRTFLLTALDRYVTSIHRKETAKKRRPASGLASLETDAMPEMPAAELETSPEHTFQYAWAASILDQVLAELRQEYYSTGRAAYWEVFREKVLAPILQDSDEPALSWVCDQYSIETEKKASNMIITVKRRFAAVLRRVLRQHVQSDSQVEQELGDLVEILSRGGAA